LFRHGEAVDLAQRLENMLRMDSRQRDAMGIELRKSAIEKHSLERLAESLVALFKAL